MYRTTTLQYYYLCTRYPIFVSVSKFKFLEMYVWSAAQLKHIKLTGRKMFFFCAFVVVLSFSVKSFDPFTHIPQGWFTPRYLGNRKHGANRPPSKIPALYQTNISQCTILYQKCAHMCTFLLLNGSLWHMGLEHCGICGKSLCQTTTEHSKARIVSCAHFIGCTAFMMTSSNGNIFRVTGPLCGEFTGPGEFPTQRPVTRSFDVFFDVRLIKRLSKHSRGWWFETLSHPLWRHRNVLGPLPNFNVPGSPSKYIWGHKVPLKSCPTDNWAESRATCWITLKIDIKLKIVYLLASCIQLNCINRNYIMTYEFHGRTLWLLTRKLFDCMQFATWGVGVGSGLVGRGMIFDTPSEILIRSVFRCVFMLWYQC